MVLEGVSVLPGELKLKEEVENFFFAPLLLLPVNWLLSLTDRTTTVQNGGLLFFQSS